MAETKKYVRIKKASIEGAWYADKLGQIFEVYYENSVALGAVCYGYYSVLREDGELIITEKRPAKVGERVLITKPSPMGKQSYKTGDIFIVNHENTPAFGGVRTSDVTGFIGPKEYEVIVNNEIKNEEADEMKIDLNAMGYDELLAHGDAVMEAIKKRTFQEGFQAAKQVQRKLAKMKTSINTQARRDEIVEQAKADVKGLFKRDLGYRHDFIVNSEKRTVVALRKSFVEGYVRDRGIAKATPDDCFNIHIGKAIALRRALGLAVPDEYLNAPQPTEVRVGDFVSDDSGVNKALVIEDDSWPPFSGGAVIYLKDARKYCYRIIDDSREEVGE
ncbi:hypothetical protein C3438_19700 [Bacillus velezensis]|uniref:hypothetical protein n=1 Tax=Bacillus amyloliquefaciens group TaxID=1938374 RepID=UPI000CE0555C|nr:MULTISPECIES: hypothetical protein [Bacillus amyloliquefaciens group]AVB11544.1 hypothetical protein C3438_19700 [Bacillus velezensis]MCR6614542.1 hypothetical protein [Bacillus amyloliquefaciens]MEC0382942.1 hypothetical protein [Bacillus velezensis]WBY47644.1 hypothetical protein PF996_09625 [Bacillus velezensis]